MKNYDDIIALSEQYNIHAEYASADFYPRFRKRMQGLRLLLLSDENTVRYAAPLQQKLCEAGLDAQGLTLPFSEPVADERTCALVSERLSPFDYVLAVGAGTLNDIAKYTTFHNTVRYAAPLQQKLCEAGLDAQGLTLPFSEPVADERTCALVSERLSPFDYVLAVGAGTLNDIAKYTTFHAGKKCGVLATAASMDGFTSGVTPLIKKGFKITENAQTVSDILIDFDILCAAPKQMTGAGTGDILAKFCCLTDWKMSHLLTGESYNEEAASLMRVALEKCYNNADSICACGREGIDALLRALLISGYAMVIAGNSRPASGAEHHMSHFLEMDFLKRGKPIPLHGIKVGLGTLVSLRMYKRILERDLSFEGQEIVARLAAPLPAPEEVARILQALGCPTRFSQIGVSKDTVRDMLFNCYKIRDRFTIMTLYNKYGLMKGAADELMDLYY